MKEVIEILLQNAVSLFACFSFCGAIFIVNTKSQKLRIFEFILWLGVLALFVFSVMLTFIVYPLPVILIVIIALFLAVRYFFSTYRFILYPLLNIILLLGMEMAKDAGNTRGMGALPFGVLLVAFVLLLKLLERFSYRQFYYNGVVDIITGCISCGLILILGFRTNEWTWNMEIHTRYGLIALSVILIIEGGILFWKGYKYKNAAK